MAGTVLPRESLRCRAALILLCAMCLVATPAAAVSWDMFVEDAWLSGKTVPPAPVTLVTWLSTDQITILEVQAAAWGGAVSAAVFVSLEEQKDDSELERTLQSVGDAHRRVEDACDACSVTMSFMYARPVDTRGPPVHVLRRLALRNIRTRLALLLDVEYIPSPSLVSLCASEEALAPVLGGGSEGERGGGAGGGAALMVQAVNVHKGDCSPPPRDQEELRMLFDQAMASPATPMAREGDKTPPGGLRCLLFGELKAWLDVEVAQEVQGDLNRFKPYAVIDPISLLSDGDSSLDQQAHHVDVGLHRMVMSWPAGASKNARLWSAPGSFATHVQTACNLAATLLSHHYAVNATRDLDGRAGSSAGAGGVLDVLHEAAMQEACVEPAAKGRETCSGHGFCFVGRCMCRPGWGGVYCERGWGRPVPECRQDVTENCLLGQDGSPNWYHMFPDCVFQVSDECFFHPSQGVAQITEKRWLLSQRIEESIWTDEDTRNDFCQEYHSSFRGYSVLPTNLGKVLELGCGPYTQIHTIIEVASADVESVTLVDPLVYEYMRGAPDCRYPRGKFMDTYKTVLIDSGAEDVRFRAEFDTVVMINVIEHVRDVFLSLQNAYDALKPGGIFIFADPYSESHNGTIDTTSTKTRANYLLHPMAVKKRVLDILLSKYDTMLRLYGWEAEGNIRREEDAVWFIGRKPALGG